MVLAKVESWFTIFHDGLDKNMYDSKPKNAPHYISWRKRLGLLFHPLGAKINYNLCYIFLNKVVSGVFIPLFIVSLYWNPILELAREIKFC